MPAYDPAAMTEIIEQEEEEAKKSGSNLGRRKRFTEFDCPTCSANNPIDFGDGDEIPCSYCGLPFTVVVDDEGGFKLREG